MADCSNTPTPESTANFDLDSRCFSEAMTSNGDYTTAKASDGNVKKTFAAALREAGQEHVGEWSTNPLVTDSNQVIPYAGTNQLFRPLSLPYQVDSATNPDPNALLPDPSAGYAGELIDVSKFINETQMRTEQFSFAGYSYQGQWMPNIQIPSKADRVDGYALWETTIGKIVIPLKDDAFVTSATWQEDVALNRFEEDSILTVKTPFLSKGSTNARDLEDRFSDEVNVKDLGAVGDYYLYDDKLGKIINPNPTDDSKAIEDAYIYAVRTSKTLVIEGDFYCERQINFSVRYNQFERRIVTANAALHFNLDNTSDTIGLYVGDDTSNGQYPCHILGMLMIDYVGENNAGKVGFKFQDAAYGEYHVIPSGWDIGIYNLGSIYCSLDGRNQLTLNNNIDIKVESYQSVNPVPTLRFAANLLEIRDYTLTSTNKLDVRVGSVPDLTKTSGGLIRCVRVNFEGSRGDGSNLSAIRIERTGELVAKQPLDTLQFDNCWFEGIDRDKIVCNILKSRVRFSNCFFANTPETYFITVNDDYCSVIFEDSNVWMGDSMPSTGCVVSRIGSATDAYRSGVVSYNSVFYGISGLAVPLHDGMITAYNRIISTNTANARTVVTKWNATYPSGSSDDYCTNLQLDVNDYLNNLLGTLWVSADIEISGGSGSKYSNVSLKATKNSVEIIGDSTGLLTSDKFVLKFPDTAKAEFFSPTVIVKGIVDIDQYPLT